MCFRKKKAISIGPLPRPRYQRDDTMKPRAQSLIERMRNVACRCLACNVGLRSWSQAGERISHWCKRQRGKTRRATNSTAFLRERQGIQKIQEKAVRKASCLAFGSTALF